jgi:HK97 family phage major capsid protein
MENAENRFKGRFDGYGEEAGKVERLALDLYNEIGKDAAKAAPAGTLDEKQVKSIVNAAIESRKAELAAPLAPSKAIVAPQDYLAQKLFTSALERNLIPAGTSTAVMDSYKAMRDKHYKHDETLKAAFDITSSGAGLELRPQEWYQGVVAPMVASAPFFARTSRVMTSSNVINFPAMTDAAHTSTRNAKAGTGATIVPDSGAGTTSNTAVTLSWVSRVFVFPEDLLKFAIVDLARLYVNRALRYIGLDIEGEDLEGTNSWWAATSVKSSTVKSSPYVGGDGVYDNFIKTLKLLSPEYRQGGFALTMHDNVHTKIMLAKDDDNHPIFPIGQYGNQFGGATGTFVGVPYLLSAKPATDGGVSNIYVGDPANYIQLMGLDFRVQTNPYEFMRYHCISAQVDVLTAGILLDTSSIGKYTGWPTA